MRRPSDLPQEEPLQAASRAGGDEALEAWRRRIDDIDRRLVEALAERQGVVEEIAELKKPLKQPVYHPAR